MSQSFPRNRDEWLEPPDEVEAPRNCAHCGEGMFEGYLIFDDTYCSEKCVNASGDLDYDELHEKNPDDCFWTEWEEGE